jgi:hexosaminidase
VSAPEVPQPVAVRFAFENTSEPNLFNAEGLPASCFRTDDWPALWPNPVFKIKQILENGDALLNLSTPDPLCRVRYTLDGSTPSDAQGEWAQPDSLIRLPRGKRLKTRVFDRNAAPSDRCDSLALRQHLASGKPAVGTTGPAPQYPGSAGEHSLTDGLLGSPQTHDAAWSGYAGDSPTWTFDLGEKRRVRQVSVGFLTHTRSWVFPPAEVQVSLSDDGERFGKPITLSEPQPKQHTGPSVLRLTAEWSRDARFVRVSVKNIGTLPDWHPAVGSKAWLFVDEVEVE